MPRGTVSTPVPPRPYPLCWPNPQMTLPRPPPNMPPTNGPVTPVFPIGGGGNP